MSFRTAKGALCAVHERALRSSVRRAFGGEDKGGEEGDGDGHGKGVGWSAWARTGSVCEL
jgi:hypothetical protein